MFQHLWTVALSMFCALHQITNCTQKFMPWQAPTHLSHDNLNSYRAFWWKHFFFLVRFDGSILFLEKQKAYLVYHIQLVLAWKNGTYWNDWTNGMKWALACRCLAALPNIIGFSLFSPFWVMWVTRWIAKKGSFGRTWISKFSDYQFRSSDMVTTRLRRRKVAKK